MMRFFARCLLAAALAATVTAQQPQPVQTQPPPTQTQPPPVQTGQAPPVQTQPPPAQQPPPPPPAQTQPPVFKTGTNVIRVDVSVADRSGVPVRTLTAADFEVREDDKPQAITTFRLVETNGQPTDAFSLPIRSVDHAAAEAAREDVRVFVIFWDEYHIGEFQSAIRAREDLTRFVLEAFGPTDLVAIVDPLTPLSAIRFTRDRRALAERVHTLRGRRGVYIPTRSAIEEEQLRSRIPVERLRAQVTTTALKATVMHLGALREGRKSLLFISESLGPLGTDESGVLSDLMRTANHNNTGIYTFDPRGLQAGRGRPSAALHALATQSGAEFYSSNDMGTALKRVVTRAGAYYLLGYSPADSPLDGKFRKISVKVNASGAHVHARSGYWQLRAEDLVRAREAAAKAELPPAVTTANRQLTPSGSHRPIELWAGFAFRGPGAPTVTVAWSPRAGFTGSEAPVSVDLEAKLNGAPVASAAATTQPLTFSAGQGTLLVVATTKNAAGDILDREQRTLEIPSASGAALGLSTPVVLRARSARDVRALDSGEIGASASRDFSRTDRLRVRVAPYGEAAQGAVLTAVLLNARGSKLADLPIRRAADAVHHEVDLPLTSVALGEFLIRLDARAGDAKADALVAFRVGR